MKILVSTGEVSGDVIGARIASEIFRRCPEASIFGIGGPRMETAGVVIDFGTNHLGTVGITEPFFAVPAFARALGRVRRRVRREPPDAALLIGNDVFNVLLGRWLKGRGIPTVSCFPPQVWIWRSLSRPISRSYDLILTSFPEEQTVYERTGVPTRFVGHYLCETLAPVTASERVKARQKYALPAEGTVVGLMPGSRIQEVRRFASILLDAADLLLQSDSSLRFILPVAEPLYEERIARELKRRSFANRVVLAGGNSDAMRAADLILLASGTASLEAALLGIPMVIIYRVSAFTMWVVRTAIRLGLMDSETLGLPNLALGYVAVPEIRQEMLSAPAVASEAQSLLGSGLRAEKMRRALGEVRARINGRDVIGSIAGAVLEVAARGAASPEVESERLGRSAAVSALRRREG